MSPKNSISIPVSARKKGELIINNEETEVSISLYKSKNALAYSNFVFPKNSKKFTEEIWINFRIGILEYNEMENIFTDNSSSNELKMKFKFSKTFKSKSKIIEIKSKYYSPMKKSFGFPVLTCTTPIHTKLTNDYYQKTKRKSKAKNLNITLNNVPSNFHQDKEDDVCVSQTLHTTKGLSTRNKISYNKRSVGITLTKRNNKNLYKDKTEDISKKVFIAEIDLHADDVSQDFSKEYSKENSIEDLSKDISKDTNNSKSDYKSHLKAQSNDHAKSNKDLSNTHSKEAIKTIIKYNSSVILFPMMHFNSTKNFAECDYSDFYDPINSNLNKKKRASLSDNKICFGHIRKTLNEIDENNTEIKEIRKENIKLYRKCKLYKSEYYEINKKYKLLCERQELKANHNLESIYNSLLNLNQSLIISEIKSLKACFKSKTNTAIKVQRKTKYNTLQRILKCLFTKNLPYFNHLNTQQKKYINEKIIKKGDKLKRYSVVSNKNFSSMSSEFCDLAAYVNNEKPNEKKTSVPKKGSISNSPLLKKNSNHKKQANYPFKLVECSIKK